MLWFLFAPGLWPVLHPLPWWAIAAASAAIGLTCFGAAWLLLGWLVVRLARCVEMFAAEWRKLIAAPTLPPSGGDNDGHTGPATERLSP